MSLVKPISKASAGRMVASCLLGFGATAALLWFTQCSWEAVVALTLMWLSAITSWLWRLRRFGKRMDKKSRPENS
jgi:uncharacterized membrane protein